MNKTLKFYIFYILIFIFIILVILLSEIGLRLLGYKPFVPYPKKPFEPVMHQIDPDTGIINKAGIYEYSTTPEGEKIKITILSDSSRSSENVDKVDLNKKIYFFGCSIGFGWAVDDKYVASNVIAKYTPYESVNLSVGGLGSYEALLLLKRAAKKWAYNNKPKAIIYQAATHHANRNVMDPLWVHIKDNMNKLINANGQPYIRLDSKGNIKEFRHKKRFIFPLREYSALMALLEEAYLNVKYGITFEEAREINLKVISEMNNVAKKFEIPFFVVFVYSTDIEYYQTAFSQLNIKSFDCNHQKYNSGDPNFKVPVDNHPNASVHEYYAKCIIKNLGLELLNTEDKQ
ncbi:MAG: hypothetical protein J0H68_05890 [Sphingobacteriia bacterium]|nr:hypothetical protein [Sphingobacteriia bacterium]